MATSKQDIWQHLKAKEFTKATEMINKDPELVNAINSLNTSVLMYVSTNFKENAREFLQFVMTHPKLNLQYKKSERSSNIQAIIQLQKPELLQYVIKNPVFFVCGNKLTYELVKDDLTASLSLYNASVRDNPSDLALQKSYKNDAEAYQKMLPIIRDATIQHAVATDDASLMERLKKAGAEPSDPLSNGKSASDLLKTKSGKVYNWLLNEFNASMMQGVQASRNTQAHQDLSFFADMQAIERQKEECKARHLAAKNAILEKGLQEQKSLLSRMFSK